MMRQIDFLESRRLLAVSAPLLVGGTASDDTISVTASGSGALRMILVNRNGRQSSFLASQINGVLVKAGAGDAAAMNGGGETGEMQAAYCTSDFLFGGKGLDDADMDSGIDEFTSIERTSPPAPPTQSLDAFDQGFGSNGLTVTRGISAVQA